MTILSKLTPLNKLQKWFMLHCNGDWEHEKQIELTTMSDPGWSVKINLNDTALQGQEFHFDYKNENNPFDWYKIQTKENSLFIYCGLSMIEESINFFIEEIFEKFYNKNFTYEIYVPVYIGLCEAFIPCLGIISNLYNLKIIDIPKPIKRLVKVKNLDYTFSQLDLDKVEITKFIGKEVSYRLEEVFNYIILSVDNCN